MIDLLTSERVTPLVRGRFGRPYLYRPTCTSTQEVIGAESGEGSVVVCDRQSSGRGRLGRTWHAPAGTAILCSILLRPPEGRRLPELTLVGGLATARTVEDATHSTTSIKWPNDVILDGRKVAGILAAAVDGVVVLGIGLNVNQEAHQLPVETKFLAGSLRTSDGLIRERAPLLANLLFELESSYQTWRDRGIASLIDSIQDRDFLRGQRVVVGGESAQAIGITATGQLEVQAHGTSRMLDSDEVDLDFS